MDVDTLLGLKWITDKHGCLCSAQGALSDVLWQPGWEGSLGENGYVYTHG